MIVTFHVTVQCSLSCILLLVSRFVDYYFIFNMNSTEAILYSKSRGVQHAAYNLYLHDDLVIKPDDKILDVGCGTGDLVYKMGGVAQLTIGLDISKKMIDVARQKFQRANVSYEVADFVNFLETFPNWKGVFNKVVSIHALHWGKERMEAFQNIYDCLKPGGECFLLLTGSLHQLLGHNEDELPYFLKNHTKWKQHLQGYEHKMYNQLTLEENMQLLKSVGFDVVEGDLHTPCSEIDIYSKEQLRDYVQTLVGHVNYVPEQYRSELLRDATDWCYKNFPVNQRGNKYMRIDIIVLRAKKTENSCTTFI